MKVIIILVLVFITGCARRRFEVVTPPLDEGAISLRYRQIFRTREAAADYRSTLYCRQKIANWVLADPGGTELGSFDHLSGCRKFQRDIFIIQWTGTQYVLESANFQ